MTYVNISKFVLINELEKDHNMIETRRLKNVVIFIESVLISYNTRCITSFTFIYYFQYLYANYRHLLLS